MKLKLRALEDQFKLDTHMFHEDGYFIAEGHYIYICKKCNYVARYFSNKNREGYGSYTQEIYLDFMTCNEILMKNIID